MRIAALAMAAAATFALAGAASAVTITFEGAVGGNPADAYQEGDYIFQPNAASNDSKCAEGECLNEYRQGVITTMVKDGGGAFDLLGFYFVLVGNGSQTQGVQDITVKGTFADSSTKSLTFALNDLLSSFAPDSSVTGYDNPAATSILKNDGYVVSILNGLFNGVVKVDWTTNSQGVQSANARLDNVVVADPAPIPVPAAGWLLLGGLGALAAARRRRAA
ncbi:MAG: VPLPA-CTERM sorting domain-containing protein [Rhodobacteraceae bacterium]|nr:VPLPA-CTERM sorting domain-containing protein [Paracoccaceae bacterium]